MPQTFKQARTALLEAFASHPDWTVTTYNRGHSLKVPYARRDHDGRTVWFKAQALYLGHDALTHARSMSEDQREETLVSILGTVAYYDSCQEQGEDCDSKVALQAGRLARNEERARQGTQEDDDFRAYDEAMEAADD